MPARIVVLVLLAVALAARMILPAFFRLVEARRMRKSLLLIILLLLLPLALACDVPGSPALTHSPSNTPLSLSQVKAWAYQIQQISAPGAVDALADSHYDLLVAEPTRTDWSSEETKRFDTKAMVDRLKASFASDGLHRKLVFAYLDIGEAENWRWYWTWSKDWEPGRPRPADWPSYIVTQDPDGWSGNFPIAYWDPRWKDIVIYGQDRGIAPDRDYRSALDEVISDGFDGIYLDWVEAFSNDQVIAAARQAGVDPTKEMIDFIREMRAYAQRYNPNFQIVQQNATDLLDGHAELLKVIDALAQEDTWYGGQADVDWNNPRGYDQPQDPAYTKTLLSYLDRYKTAGKTVFTIDYTVVHASEVYEQARSRGYIPYCSRTSLSQLTTTPPPGYP